MDDLPHTKFHDHPAVPIAVAFDLHLHGWASLTISAGDAQVEIGQFGYCTDALGDLVRAATLIAMGGSSAQVILDGEPALWGIALQDGWQSIYSPPALRLIVKADYERFDGTECPTSIPIASWSQLLVEAYVTADGFARAISDAAHKILDAFGEQGYRRRWVEHHFPMRALAALDACLTLPYEDNRPSAAITDD